MLQCTQAGVRCNIKDVSMTNRKPISAIAGFMDLMGSAVAVSRAVEAHRKPRSSDLRRLGIDPAAFTSIQRR